jgi:hypothetical protein
MSGEILLNASTSEQLSSANALLICFEADSYFNSRPDARKSHLSSDSLPAVPLARSGSVNRASDL